MNIIGKVSNKKKISKNISFWIDYNEQSSIYNVSIDNGDENPIHIKHNISWTDDTYKDEGYLLLEDLVLEPLYKVNRKFTNSEISLMREEENAFKISVCKHIADNCVNSSLPSFCMKDKDDNIRIYFSVDHKEIISYNTIGDKKIFVGVCIKMVYMRYRNLSTALNENKFIYLFDKNVYMDCNTFNIEGYMKPLKCVKNHNIHDKITYYLSIIIKNIGIEVRRNMK